VERGLAPTSVGGYIPVRNPSDREICGLAVCLATTNAVRCCNCFAEIACHFLDKF
jgi:hypothetical protein